MAIANGYVTLAEAKRLLDISDAIDDGQLERVIEASSRLIDEYTGRRFYSALETRVYTPERFVEVKIDDLASLTDVITDENEDGTAETTWPASDYALLPPNAALEGRPYTSIAITPWGAKEFPTTLNSVEITGNFGWPIVPEPVRQACLIQVGTIYRSKEAPFGVIGNAETGIVRMSARLHPEAQLLLDPYRRRLGLAW
jgi:hypothetical protein